MASRVVAINSRELVAVRRSSLSEAAEDAVAASLNAKDALDRALNAVWSGNRAAAVHQLSRIGFEIGQRMEALTALTALAEVATACPDQEVGPSHGRAA